MKVAVLTLAAVLLMLESGQTEEQAAADRPGLVLNIPRLCFISGHTPFDAKPFLRRAADCNRFRNETPSDDARARFLKRKIRSLRCDRLAADEAALLARYPHDEVLRDVIEVAKEADGREACGLD